MLDFKRRSNDLSRFLRFLSRWTVFASKRFISVRACVRACVRVCVCYRPNGVHQLTFRRDTTYDNLLPPEAVNPGIALQTRTRIHCAKMCREEEWCNSYFYNDVTRLCLRHRTVYLAPPAIASCQKKDGGIFGLNQVYYEVQTSVIYQLVGTPSCKPSSPWIYFMVVTHNYWGVDERIVANTVTRNQIFLSVREMNNQLKCCNK